MFFHWELLNEKIRTLYPRRAEQTGLFVVRLKDPQQAAEVSAAIDAMFRNSLAETLSETEKAFQLSFVAMTEAILVAIQAVSYLVIVIIMAVMANTMAMTARERSAGIRTMKAIGFGNAFVATLIFAESLGLIQNTQNRDSAVLQLKLDELIRVSENARNNLLDLEGLTEEELNRPKGSFTRLAGAPDTKLLQEAVGDLDAAGEGIRGAKEKMAAVADKKS